MVRVSDEDEHAWNDRWQYEVSGEWPTMGNPQPAGRPSPSRLRLYESQQKQLSLTRGRPRLNECRTRAVRRRRQQKPRLR